METLANILGWVILVFGGICITTVILYFFVNNAYKNMQCSMEFFRFVRNRNKKKTN